MIVRAISGEYLIDPDGVYLAPGDKQPNFRVMSVQRLKMNGVRLVGCFNDTEIDVLQDRVTKKTINLAEEGPDKKKILVLETLECPEFRNKQEMKSIVNDIRRRNRTALVHLNDLGVNDNTDQRGEQN